jgi:hypothetical protein
MRSGSMSAAPLSYQALRHQLRTEVVRHELTSGQGGPLLFVWAVGVAFFWLQDLPLYLVIWTVAVAGLAGLAVRDALRRPMAFAEAARVLAQRQFRDGGGTSLDGQLLGRRLLRAAGRAEQPAETGDRQDHSETRTHGRTSSPADAHH